MGPEPRTLLPDLPVLDRVRPDAIGPANRLPVRTDLPLRRGEPHPPFLALGPALGAQIDEEPLVLDHLDVSAVAALLPVPDPDHVRARGRPGQLMRYAVALYGRAGRLGHLRRVRPAVHDRVILPAPEQHRVREATLRTHRQLVAVLDPAEAVPVHAFVDRRPRLVRNRNDDERELARDEPPLVEPHRDVVLVHQIVGCPGAQASGQGHVAAPDLEAPCQLYRRLRDLAALHRHRVDPALRRGEVHLVAAHRRRVPARTDQRGEVVGRPAIDLDPVLDTALKLDPEALPGRKGVEARGHAPDRDGAPVLLDHLRGGHRPAPRATGSR